MSFGPRLRKNKPPSDTGEAILPAQSDSQQGDDMVGQTASEEMYLSTVEEESGDETMLMGTSTGADDDLDVPLSRKKRMVKLKDKDKLKVKPCKTIIIEEEPPPAPPASGKHLAEVIARLSREEIGVVLGHVPSSTVQNWVQSFGAQQSLSQSSGASTESCGLRFFPGDFQNFEKQSSCPQQFLSLARF